MNWFKRNSPPSAPHLALGERGEQCAARFLRRHGYKVLLRHFRSPAGEIDIVARHRDTLVFVEVKTRKSELFGPPSTAVDQQKQRHLSRVAFDYVRLLDDPRVKIRFDIVEVVIPAGARQPEAIRLIPNAFELPEPYRY